MSDQSMRGLERALFDLGNEIAYPPVPAVAHAVTRSIQEGRRPISRLGSPLRRLALVGVAALALAVGVMTFSPTAREAVADFLGIGGIRIVSPQEQPTLPPPRGNLRLGEPVADIATAQRLVGFEVLVPSLEGFEAPDGVYVSNLPPTDLGRVSLTYEPRIGLPKSSATRLGLLITEFEAGVEETYVKKLIAGGVRVRRVLVNGTESFWIAGGPHLLTFVDDTGRVVSDSTRLAGNTLIWERSGLTLRLESALGLRAVLQIAESIQ